MTTVIRNPLPPASPTGPARARVAFGPGQPHGRRLQARGREPVAMLQGRRDSEQERPRSARRPRHHHQRMPSCEACYHQQIYAAFAISSRLEPIPSSDPSLFQNLSHKPNPNILSLMRIGDCNSNVPLNHKIVVRTGTGSMKSQIP
jgi:hypothetical protein